MPQKSNIPPAHRSAKAAMLKAFGRASPMVAISASAELIAEVALAGTPDRMRSVATLLRDVADVLDGAASEDAKP